MELHQTPRNLTFHKYGIWALYATCLVIPLSTAATAFFTTLLTICWLGSGTVKRLPAIIKSSPVAATAVILFLLLAIGTTYSIAPLGESLSILKKYRILLFIPMVMCLVQGKGEVADRAINMFMVGCLITLVASCLMYWGILPVKEYGHAQSHRALTSPITHSPFVAIATFFVVNRMIDRRGWYYLCIPLVILAIANIFSMIQNGSGMLIFFALLALMIVQRFSIKQSVVVFVGFFCLILLIYNFVPSFSLEVNQLYSGVQNHSIASEKRRDQVTYRLDWYINSYELFQQKPVLGHGTGAYPFAQAKIIENTHVSVTGNPHNEYFLLAIQIGAIGLVVFGLLLVSQIRYSCRIPKEYGYCLQGILITMIVGCLFNSWLLDSQQSHFYAILTAVLSCDFLKCHENA